MTNPLMTKSPPPRRVLSLSEGPDVFRRVQGSGFGVQGGRLSTPDSPLPTPQSRLPTPEDIRASPRLRTRRGRAGAAGSSERGPGRSDSSLRGAVGSGPGADDAGAVLLYNSPVMRRTRLLV